MSGLGRILQLAGLTIPLLAIFAQLAGSISVRDLLMFMIAALCLFWIGQLIQSKR